MSQSSRTGFVATFLLVIASAALARPQSTLPPVRSIGPVTKVSAHGLLRSAANARQFPDGRVIVGDLRGQRVVILDSTLQSRVIIGDTSATGSPMGFLAGVIPYRGDSTLLVDRDALAFVIVDSHGAVGRVMAAPRPKDIGQLFGGPYGMPGFDPQGRLVYRASAWLPFDPSAASRGPSEADSAAIVRLNLGTRTIDTLARYKIVTHNIVNGRSPKGDYQMTVMSETMPQSDEWGLLSDGTVAIVRGRDYHVDFVTPAGTTRKAPRIPYTWIRLTDSAKAEFRDSVIAYSATRAEEARKQFGVSGRTNGPRHEFSPVSAMPDYLPPFGNSETREGIVRVDRNDNLWVRTNTVLKGSPVYDVINRQGVLIDRVRLPFGRSLAGFGANTVLMAVIDRESVLLEVARLK